MSYDLSIVRQLSLAGKSYTHQETISQPEITGIERSIPVALAGTLTTRTDANTGVVTMDSVSHGITTSDKVDVYWDGGQRRYMTVTAVSSALVTIDLGGGDNLPVITTVMQVAVAKVYSFDVIGDNISALVAAVDVAKGTIVLLDTSGAAEQLVMTIKANGDFEWTGTTTNPLAGITIDTVHMSHNDLVTAQNVRVAALRTV